MKTRFGLFLALLLLPVFSWAEGNDSLLEDRVPQQMTKSSDGGQKTVWNLLGYEIYSFRGFSLGKATGLPIEEQNRFVRVIAEAKPDQVVFIQGIADKNPWHNRAKVEFPSLDFGVAMARARWAVSKATESFPEVSGKIKLLTPAPEHDRRGLNIYVATYEKENKVATSSPFSLDIKVGVFTGTSFVSVGRMNFFVPTAGLLLKSGPWEVSFFGGWRPTSKHKDFLGERAESLVGAEIALRDGWLGYSAGVNTAWETLLDHDQKYVNRATGFYVGPKFFASANDFIFNAGANVQVLNLNRFGRNDSWWKTGYGLSFELQRLFN